MMRFAIDGTQITVRTDAAEQEVLSGLIREFTSLAETRRSDPTRGETTPKDPALARLLPDPIADDREAAADLRFMTEASILDHKLTNARTVAATLHREHDDPAALDAASELAWLKTLTDLRLVLAARLGIEHDGDRGRRQSDTDRWMQAAYHWLGTTQADLLETIDARDAQRAAPGDDEPGA